MQSAFFVKWNTEKFSSILHHRQIYIYKRQFFYFYYEIAARSLTTSNIIDQYGIRFITEREKYIS